MPPYPCHDLFVLLLSLSDKIKLSLKVAFRFYSPFELNNRKNSQLYCNRSINNNFSYSSFSESNPAATIHSEIAKNRQNKAISANCPRSCPTISTPNEPVCGSDGLIYANVCEMKKKTCSRNGVVGVTVNEEMFCSNSEKFGRNNNFNVFRKIQQDVNDLKVCNGFFNLALIRALS